MKLNWVRLLACVVGTNIVGNIGSLATFSQITTWYATLEKPWFNPPNWLFGPAWTLLFTLMGISLYLILSHAGKREMKTAVLVFSIQMVLNVLWSFIFFGWHQLGIAFAEIVILWVAILVTIINFSRISKVAAWILVPYLGWVTFASLLNFAVWQLSR
ncbi:MAG TPA: TspO/MBR family protein [Patescibacteria group bacterium]